MPQLEPHLTFGVFDNRYREFTPNSESAPVIGYRLEPNGYFYTDRRDAERFLAACIQAERLRYIQSRPDNLCLIGDLEFIRVSTRNTEELVLLTGPGQGVILQGTTLHQRSPDATSTASFTATPDLSANRINLSNGEHILWKGEPPCILHVVGADLLDRLAEAADRLDALPGAVAGKQGTNLT